MSKLSFLSDNLLHNSLVTLQVGTANAQFPLANIKKAFTTKVFRSNEDTVSILIDLQSIQPVDTFAICGDSIEGGLGFDSAILKSSATTDFSGSTPITIDLSQEYGFGFKMFSSVSNRYWLLTLTGVDYVEVSNFFIGSKTELTNNDFSTTSFEFSDKDKSIIAENRYGQKFINQFNKQQVLGGNINLVNAAELIILKEISTRHGKNNPVWFILDPLGAMSIEGSEFLFSGYFYFDNDFKWKTITKNYFSVSISLEEVI